MTAQSTWMSISEADWNYVNRTKVTGPTEFDTSGRRRLFFRTGLNGTVVDSFKECVDYRY